MPQSSKSLSRVQMEEDLPFPTFFSRFQPQQTRTVPYTTATCKHFKPQKLKATQNKLWQKFNCRSSSFEDKKYVQTTLNL
jgi:hypothetical protein